MTNREKHLEELLTGWLELDPTKPGAVYQHAKLIERTELAIRTSPVTITVYATPDPFPETLFTTRWTS
jgi:hypothetical protein